MLKFVGMRLPFEITTVLSPMPDHRMLFDLPSYCYDMHTRVGLAMLKWIVHGVDGGKAIRDFMREFRVESPHRVLGEALFFVEGGRIRGELIYPPLCHLEQRYFAHKSGLSLEAWLQLQILVEQALLDGVIDRVREDVLYQFYGSLFAIDSS